MNNETLDNVRHSTKWLWFNTIGWVKVPEQLEIVVEDEQD